MEQKVIVTFNFIMYIINYIFQWIEIKREEAEETETKISCMWIHSFSNAENFRFGFISY